MSEHPIENLMTTAMNSIKDMVDVNTIVGEPIQTSNNMVIIPISKVGFGFAAGGSEFRGETINEYTKKDKEEAIAYKLPFGGGAGAGVSISPIAFLVVSSNNVKLLPVDHNSCLDRLIDYVPDLIDKCNNILNKQIQDKKEEKIEKIKNENKGKNGKTENDNVTKNVEIVNQTKPRVNTKVRKPQSEQYEFEYDETDDKNEYKENNLNDQEYYLDDDDN